MRHKFFCGSKPKFTDSDKDMFSRGDYCCHRLLLTVDGKPVGITRHIDPDVSLWKVVHGTFEAVFGSYEAAMEFCKDRYRDLDGKPIRE